MAEAPMLPCGSDDQDGLHFVVVMVQVMAGRQRAC